MKEVLSGILYWICYLFNAIYGVLTFKLFFILLLAAFFLVYKAVGGIRNRTAKKLTGDMPKHE